MKSYNRVLNRIEITVRGALFVQRELFMPYDGAARIEMVRPLSPPYLAWYFFPVELDTHVEMLGTLVRWYAPRRNS